MTEVYPISCISCRRRKIKCNKIKPCNQCDRRTIKCQYPETFRNIKINETLIEKADHPHGAGHAHGELAIQNGVLSQERQFLSQVNENLTEQNEKLNSKVQKLQEENHHSHYSHSTGETSESGEKFYGPSSSAFMIESLKNSNDEVDFHEENIHSKVQRSLVKKHLPIISHLSKEDNLRAIKSLVAFFFTRYYYSAFISYKRCQEFLDNYENENFENGWENDDDLLLLHMVLITSVRKLSKAQLTTFDLTTRTQKKLLKYLFRSYDHLRHNLINESIFTVQSYILAVEHHFYNQKHEESWSMMFHCTSIAYSIGLHVCGKNIDPHGDEDLNERLSIWFAVKLTAGMLCSALGRPNPISLEISNLGSFDKINWKIGLSECLRLSNLMLIESYMTNIELNNLIQLETKFSTETQLVENYYQQQLLNRPQQLLSEHLELNKELLTDLILFYSNRSKLWQPFINQYTEASNIITTSVINVLNFASQLIQYSENKHIRRVYPFVYSSIYQSLVVFYTYLHYNFQNLNRELTVSIQLKIQQLYELDSNWQINMKTIVSKINEVIAKFIAISPNHQFKNHMNQHQLGLPIQNQIQMDHNMMNSFEMDPTLGFDLADPFFIQHPENIPYYSSPSSIDEQIVSRHQVQNPAVNVDYNYYADPFNATSY